MTIKYSLIALLFSTSAFADWLDEIEASRRHHEEAQSYAEWSQSPWHPEALAARFSREISDPAQQKALCRKLRNWPAADLYHVSELIEIQPQGCLAQFRARYETYLLKARLKTLNKVDRSQIFNLGNSTEPGWATTTYPLDFDKMSVVIDGHLPAKTLALTFDDGPHPTRTPQLLADLKKEGIFAHFFMVGNNSSLYPQLVKQVASEGHELGSHSRTHADLRKLTLNAAVREIEGGFSPIAAALGQPVTFFRFPYGANTKDLRKYLSDTRTPEFFWNIDTLDWKYKDPEFLFNYALAQIRKNAHGVVLFHDIQPQTIAIVPALLQTLKGEGYQFAILRPVSPRLTPKE